MIPLMHLIYFCNFALSFFIMIRIFTSYQKLKSKNLRNFLLAFLSIGIYFLLVSLPGLVINNPFLVRGIYIISYIPLHLAALFMILVFLNIFKVSILRVRISEILIALLLVNMVANFILNNLYYSPAAIRTFGQFYYWPEGTPFWLQIVTGILIGLVLVFVSLNFLIEGVRSTEKIVRDRALLIGFGVAFFLISAISNFVFAVYLQEVLYRTIATIIGGALSLVGLGFIFWGIYYTPRKA